MRKIIIIIVLIISAFSAYTQDEDSNDFIYPLEGKRIKNCKIIDVQISGRVIFNKEELYDTIQAKAVLKDGNYYQLQHLKSYSVSPDIQISELDQYSYKGKSYTQYSNRYFKSKHIITNGMVFLAVGSAAAGIGAGLILYIDKEYSGEKVTPAFALLAVPAGFYFISGVSFMTTGLIMISVGSGTASLYKDKMKKALSNQYQLSFGFCSQGIGFTLKL